MAELEKVIKGLSICGGDDPDCQHCPYYGEYGDGFGCETIMQRDALSLLKAQEPRVMTLEEVEDALDTVVWVDRPLLDNSSDEYALIDAYSRKTQIVELRYPFCDKNYRERADYANYGKTWRCWNARPSDSERKNTPWEK